jgi:hypothetical protein
VKGASLPSGCYDNSFNNLYKIMGPPIKVRNGDITFTLNSQEMGIWLFEKNVNF